MKKDPGVRIQESGQPADADMPQPGLSATVPAGEAADAPSKPRRALARPVAAAKGRREIVADFTQLQPAWQELAKKLIEEGSSVEDIVEIFAERGGPVVTEHAIEAHYQSSFELQRLRTLHLVKQAEKLRRALADPNSDDARLAGSTLLLGLVQLRRNSSRLTIKDAHSLRTQRQNLQLRQRVLKMKLGEQVRKKSEWHQRYLWEEERRRHLQLENKKLEEILKHLRKDETLPADVMGKIQEIYGIVKEPYIPEKLAAYLPKE